MIVDIIRRCNSRIGQSLEQIQEFRDKLDNDMVRAMTRSEEYFMYAAEYKVYLSIRTAVEEFKLAALSAEAWVANYKNQVVAKVLYLARDNGSLRGWIKVRFNRYGCVMM